MDTAAKIVGIDIIWMDELITLAAMPADNGSAPMEKISYQGGGKVCTALVAAARQEIPCKIIGVKGDSARSRFLTEDFVRHGIDVSGLRTIPGYTEGTSVVLSDAQSSGRRILWRYDSTQPGLTRADIAAAEDDIAAAEYLHLCRMDDIDCYAAELAHKHGTSVCFDGDFHQPGIERKLHLVDLLIGSEEFYAACFPQGGDPEENFKALSKLGPSVVIFTFGKKGCKCYTQNNYFHVPAYHENITVIDTVGAGDVFHGGYLAALCHGLNPVHAAQYASAVSAIKCTAIGGRAGIPNREMVQEYLRYGTFSSAQIEARRAFYETPV